MTSNAERWGCRGAKAVFSLVVFTAFALQAAADDRVKVIRIGSTGPGHFKFILGWERRAWDQEFAKDGIRIEYFPFNGGGSEAVTALASGSLDVAYTASDPALRVASARADVKLVGLSSFTKIGASSIFVRADSPIRSVRDLRGRRIAYLAGTVRHASLVRALQSAGLSLRDVQSLQLASNVSGPALIRGDVDALVESELSVWTLLQRGAIHILVDGRQHPEWATPSVISVNGEFARRHPDIVKRVLKADLEITRWAESHPDEAIKVFSGKTKAPEAYIRRLYPDGHFHADPRITGEAINALRAEEAFMRSTGLQKGAIDYAAWIDRRYIDAVYAGSNSR